MGQPGEVSKTLRDDRELWVVALTDWGNRLRYCAMTSPPGTDGFRAVEAQAPPDTEAVRFSSLRGLHSASELFALDRNGPAFLARMSVHSPEPAV